MKRIIITAAALVAAIPASLGLMGNASFAQSVPVRVPAHATLLGDQSKHLEIGDDKGGLSTHLESGDDKAGASAHLEPGDDKGGASTPVAPGDDKGSLNSTQIKAGNDKVSTSTSGKADDGAKVDVQGGTDNGAGHQ
jgi:hypothetical protein